MAINTNFPNVRPSLLLDFANAQQLDSRVTFSRSTTAPYYDGKTSVKAEENLFKQSQAFNVTWVVASGSSLTLNSTTAPDGTTTGSTLTITAQFGGINQFISGLTTGASYTISLYAKSNTGSNAYSMLDNSGGSGIFGTFTPTASWARYSFTFTAASTSATLFVAQDRNASGFGAIDIWGAQLEQRSSVTAYNATTTTAITNYIPQLQTAPINSPRFDFNPTTGESLGLLIEQSSTNLFFPSIPPISSFTFSANVVSALANQNIAPDGTQTAIQYNLNAFGIYQYSLSTLTNATTYTVSMYVKGTTNYVKFGVCDSSSSNGFFGSFDLIAVSASGGLYGSGGTYTNSTITAVGNGWYRCTVTGITGTMANSRFAFATTSTTVAVSYFAWNAQVEQLSFATSAIPTTSAQVTRASDNASMTGTNFSSWYNLGQGTLYSESATNRPSADVSAISIRLSDGTNNNRIQLGRTNATSLAIRTYVTTNGTDIVSAQGNGTTTQGQFAKTSFSFINNNFTGSALGLITNTTSTGNVPNLNKLDIGFDSVNSGAWVNGWIKKIAYYPQQVTSTNQQALTGT